jgi:transposase
MGGGADASRESVDATCKRDLAPQVRGWGDRTGDCPLAWHCAQYGGATLERAAAAKLPWPLAATLTDRVLEAMLYASAGAPQGGRRKAEPDWTAVHRELRRPGVTLMLLWEEYRASERGGYSYSRWCELYRAWEGRLSPTMRQSHPAGERMFVDYAGQTVELVDGRSGEIRQAQIFVAVMGASSYTYAAASSTQSLPDWIGSHVRALAFMGGVPAQLVPDNPKVGVARANWYEPGLNRTYLELATHYRTAILPARPRSHATRRRSRSACWWSSVGSWRGCGTGGSSRSPS